MSVLTKYILPRILTYIAVIFIGITICFVIPRLTPLDPVMVAINRFSQYGQYYDPESLDKMIDSMKELYGLKGSLFEQYIAFLRRALTGDFGPSLINFPIPAVDLVRKALPWTVSLLSMSTIISWLLGNFIGGVTGYFSDKRWAKALTAFATVVYPTPYYIMALLLMAFLTYVIPIFPTYGATSLDPALTLKFIADYLYHAALPSLSLVMVGYGWWFLSIRNIVLHTKQEEFVQYGEITGLPRRTILLRYVIRNSLLPQVTGLSVALGGIFSGAMITEAVFSYPGLGYVLLNSVTTGDFNLMMAIVTYSIIAVATSTLILDLLYPLIDPRIRYK
jgi:peptide/nickel transport system permease protein